MKLIKKHKAFGGWTEFYSHDSHSTKTPMNFAVFIPPQAKERKLPCLYWLSGLTCTEENFITKAGVQKVAAEKGMIIVAPDTSPRGANIEGENDSYDLGTGAGFYVNATTSKWNQHYRMYDYIVNELPQLVEAHLPVLPDKCAISGHSMGGHGALVIGLRNPKQFQSISAFSPICHPTQCPWGKKAFTNYLGDEVKSWEIYDATLLVKNTSTKPPLLIDQGTDDEFLKEQLHPQMLEEACKAANHPLELRMQPGYDHSYYFISSFIEDHLTFHLKQLGG